MDQSNTVDAPGTLRVVARKTAADPDMARVGGLPSTYTLADNAAAVVVANDGANRLPIPRAGQTSSTKRDGLPKHAAKQIVPMNVRARSNFLVDAHIPVVVGVGRCYPNSRIARGPHIDIAVHPCSLWVSKSHCLGAVAFLRGCHSDSAGEVVVVVHPPNSFLPDYRVDIAVAVVEEAHLPI